VPGGVAQVGSQGGVKATWGAAEVQPCRVSAVPYKEGVMVSTVCVHFWKLTPPSQGGTKGKSVGVCKFCQESREFSNEESNERKLGWQHTRKNQGVKVRY
jgi:hypothetical protein